MKKKNIIITLGVFLILVAGVFGWGRYDKAKQEEYRLEMLLISFKMYGDFYVEEAILDGYSTVWSKAISRGDDFSTALQLQVEKVTTSDVYEDIEKDRKIIEKGIKSLQNPPKKYKESHEKLLDMYTEYSELKRQVDDPSGSLLTFNQKANQLSSDFYSKYDKFLLSYPGDAKKEKEEYMKLEAEKEN